MGDQCVVTRPLRHDDQIRLREERQSLPLTQRLEGQVPLLQRARPEVPVRQIDVLDSERHRSPPKLERYSVTILSKQITHHTRLSEGFHHTARRPSTQSRISRLTSAGC